MGNPARKRELAVFFGTAIFLSAKTACAMHLADGILPATWAGIWFLAALPFVAFGLLSLKRRSAVDPLEKPKVALVGAAIFVVSCLPIPVPGLGATSHACGTGLAALLIGPHATVVVSAVALLLQALFLAHGGLTTLGAGLVSMGVIGAYTGYGLFVGLRTLRVPVWLSAFLAGALSDWLVYTVTALQLSLAIHGSGAWASMFKMVLLAFLPTQLPIGLFDGVLAAGAYTFVARRRPELLAFSAMGTERV